MFGVRTRRLVLAVAVSTACVAGARRTAGGGIQSDQARMHGRGADQRAGGEGVHGGRARRPLDQRGQEARLGAGSGARSRPCWAAAAAPPGQGDVCARPGGRRDLGAGGAKYVLHATAKRDRPNHHAAAPDHLVLGHLLARGRHRRSTHPALPVRRRDPGADPVGRHPADPGRARLPPARDAVREHRGAADDAAARGVRSDVGDRLFRCRKRKRPLPQPGRRGDRGADAAGAVTVPRVLRRRAHRRRRDRAVARAARTGRRGVRDRVDAAAGVCGAGLAGQTDLGSPRGRAADRADPV